MMIKILTEGGNMTPGPALSQQLGPAGVNLGQVISKVNDATKEFKGLKVPVEIDVDTKTKDFTVSVFSPPVAELLKKELGLEKGTGEHKKLSVGNASIEQIISIAKTKLPNMLCNNLKTAVKTVVGTCGSLGILVENKPATELGKDIDSGKFDTEITEGKTETSPEKRKKLDTYFSSLHLKQEKAIKEEEAAKEAAEAAKAEAAVSGDAGEKTEGTGDEASKTADTDTANADSSSDNKEPPAK
jgi:large subunit ribosomal protein L11